MSVERVRVRNSGTKTPSATEPGLTNKPPKEIQHPKPRKFGSKWKVKLAPYLFLLPWLVGFFVITLGPMLYSFYLSFTDFSLLGSAEWRSEERRVGDGCMGRCGIVLWRRCK